MVWFCSRAPQRAVGIAYGTPDITSTPPATMTSASPALIMAMPETTASMAETQTRSIDTAVELTGMPAAIAADRATLLGMLSEEVLRPSGVHHFAAGTVQTRSGKPGFPLTAWGALPTIDTLAKVGTLVATGGAAPDGTQILDEDLIESLYATSAYQLSFWNIEYTSPTGETFAVPYMYGGGGNLVVCMPNGLVGFALADNRGAEWDAAAIRTMIGAADRIKPL